ncbi:MAG: MscL family protein [Candidatus Ancillula sp.]|jgi:large conductance mechanosensitive channel|nr:MscL family protein [Candidatus Ancillula sp.]
MPKPKATSRRLSGLTEKVTGKVTETVVDNLNPHKVKSGLDGFKNFVLKGSGMQVAIGMVIGGAFSGLISAFMNTVLNPLLAAVFGETTMDGVWILELNGSMVRFGALFTAVLNFLILTASLYFFFVLPLNKIVQLIDKENNIDLSKRPETDVDVLNKILKELKALNKK